MTHQPLKHLVAVSQGEVADDLLDAMCNLITTTTVNWKHARIRQAILSYSLSLNWMMVFGQFQFG